MNKIVKIKMTNFESWESAVIDGFCDGLNCFVGESNVGKSSIFRAIELAAYNRFSQDMVRIGADFCEVEVETTRGVVNVRRGKNINQWRITPAGGKEVFFESVGVREVDMACDILGIKTIRLCDLDVAINIMSQSESHFLISHVAGKKSSGSNRAEIIDEICGLSGAEELIREICADQLRVNKDIASLEEKVKSFKGKRHSDADLMSDRETVEKAEASLKKIDVLSNNTEYMEEVFSVWLKRSKDVNTLNEKIAALPLQDNALSFISEAEKAQRDASRMEGAWKRWASAKSCADAAASGASETADILSSVSPLIEAADGALAAMNAFQDVLCRHAVVVNDIQRLTSLLDRLPCPPDSLIAEAANIQEETARMEGSVEKHSSVSDYASNIKDEIGKLDVRLKNADKSINELYGRITVCPVTGDPIGAFCSLRNKED